MRFDTIIVAIACLAAGFLGGVLYAGSGGQKASPAGAPPAAQAPAANLGQQIRDLEQVAAREPKNRAAWVALGHAYFDSDQPMKAIEAYDQALALDGRDPDVLVDQGVMYRAVGWFDKAIANFDKALEITPTHQNALYNKGVVYLHDLEDFPKAAAAWRRLLEVAPNHPAAAQLREQIKFLEEHPPANTAAPK